MHFKIEIENDAISIIVRAADGSMRDGLSLLDQAITIQNSKIKSKDVINMLGLAERDKIYDLLEKILEGNKDIKDNYFKGQKLYLDYTYYPYDDNIFNDLKKHSSYNDCIEAHWPSIACLKLIGLSNGDKKICTKKKIYGFLKI